jgi:hypothetical protein
MSRTRLDVVPLGVPREGSSPARAETRALVAVPLVTRQVTAARGSGQSLEPDGRKGRGLVATGWNRDYPELPVTDGRHAPPPEPAIQLIVRRSRDDGWYYLHLQLQPRDAVAERSIYENFISCTVTYLDRETRRAWEERADALGAEQSANWSNVHWLNSVSVADAMFIGAWIGLKRWFHNSYGNRGLEVTMRDLLADPFVVHSEDFDDIRDVERSVIMSIDRIAQAIEVGIDFANGVEAVYAPGSKQRTPPTRRDDDGTPPDQWGG